MRLCKTSHGLRGKAWRDGEREPDDWMVEWTACDPSLVGYPALLGSSGGPGVSGTTVSLRSVPGSASRSQSDGVLYEKVDMAGNDVGQR